MWLIDWNIRRNNVKTADGFGFSAAIDQVSPDNIFTTGAKEDTVNPGTQWANNTNNKNDLLRAYVASQTSTSGNTFLYLGWVRDFTVPNPLPPPSRLS